MHLIHFPLKFREKMTVCLFGWGCRCSSLLTSIVVHTVTACTVQSAHFTATSMVTRYIYLYVNNNNNNVQYVKRRVRKRNLCIVWNIRRWIRWLNQLKSDFYIYDDDGGDDVRTSYCGQQRGCTRPHVGVSTENTLWETRWCWELGTPLMSLVGITSMPGLMFSFLR